MSYQSRQRLADQSVTFVTPASSRPSLRQRLAFTLKLWRERTAARRTRCNGCPQPARRGNFAGRRCL